MEPSAFALLMRRHNRTLYRTARAILRDDAAAEDALRLLHPLLTITTQTEDSAEGIRAFTEKRAPRWTGR